MKVSVLWKILPVTALCFAALVAGESLLSPDDSIPRWAMLVRPKLVTPSSHVQVRDLFATFNYNWDTAGEHVPSLLLTSLPPDLDRISDVSEKKRIFFLSMLPAALLANQEIAMKRERLVKLSRRLDKGDSLTDREKGFIRRLAEDYKISGDLLTSPQDRKALLKRVDVVPPALILAQAACESGYGTSRFSKVGNNIFGEWSFVPGTGIVPEERPKGATYEVKRFDSLLESVRSYLNNLNTHRAYTELRNIRHRLRSQGVPLKGEKLAAGLRLYSIQRDRYVAHIRKIIRHNRLFRFSQAQLLAYNFQT